MSNPLSGEAEANADTAEPSQEDVIAFLKKYVVGSRDAANLIGLSGRTAMHYYVRPAPDGGPGILPPLGMLNGGHYFRRKDVLELKVRLIEDGHAKNRRPR